MIPEPQAEPEVHEAVKPLEWLIGTWWGFGVMGYPGVEGSNYEQEIVFSHDGRPFLAYESKSWLVSEEGDRIRPAAREVGWWRPQPERKLEVLLTHPTGIVEVYAGEYAFHKIELASDVIARTETAKNVTAMKRLYGKVEDDLAYAIDMAAEGNTLQSHLSARLRKVP